MSTGDGEQDGHREKSAAAPGDHVRKLPGPKRSESLEDFDQARIREGQKHRDDGAPSSREVQVPPDDERQEAHEDDVRDFV